MESEADNNSCIQFSLAYKTYLLSESSLIDQDLEQGAGLLLIFQEDPSNLGEFEKLARGKIYCMLEENTRRMDQDGTLMYF